MHATAAREAGHAEQVSRSEGIIYMVLEYGDIDFAKLLEKRQRTRAAQKCLELDGNFIRCYWQQMLQVWQLPAAC